MKREDGWKRNNQIVGACTGTLNHTQNTHSCCSGYEIKLGDCKERERETEKKREKEREKQNVNV